MEPIRKDMELLSNSMATYAHLKANPESLALFFMMGVCLGLFAALCLLVTGITCRRRLHHRGNCKQPPKQPSQPPPSPERRQLRESSHDEREEEEEAASRDSAPEADTLRLSSGGRVSSAASNGTLRSAGLDVFASEEELEKARRLEERERILREIWRNGQPDILVTGTGTIGRVHYH